VIFGPLSEIDINLLTEKLDAHRAHYTIGVSKEDLHESHEEIRKRPVDPDPTYQSQKPFLFIEIADSLVHLVEEDLEKMAQLTLPEEVEELASEEYLCTQCDYIAVVPGNCPKHGTSLLEFSDYAKQATQTADSVSNRIAFAVVLVVAGLIYFYFYR
jgi:hypothetical protein